MKLLTYAHFGPRVVSAYVLADFEELRPLLLDPNHFCEFGENRLKTLAKVTTKGLWADGGELIGEAYFMYSCDNDDLTRTLVQAALTNPEIRAELLKIGAYTDPDGNTWRP